MRLQALSKEKKKITVAIEMQEMYNQACNAIKELLD